MALVLYSYLSCQSFVNLVHSGAISLLVNTRGLSGGFSMPMTLCLVSCIFVFFMMLVDLFVRLVKIGL